MRVGLVCPYSFSQPGGVQNHVIGLAEWLTTQGHEAYVLAPGECRTELRGASFTSAGGAIPVPYNGSVARVGYSPGISRRVRAWLEDVRPDVLHLHEPITPSASLLALRHAGSIPVVATFHAVTSSTLPLAVAGRVLRRYVVRLDATLAVSRLAATGVTSALGLEPTVVPNGIALGDFAAPDGPDSQAGGKPRREWRNGDRPLIATLGRVDEPRKGVRVLIRAAAELARGPRNPEIVVGGPGSAPEAHGVTFLGGLTDRERAALLGRTDVFVAPQTGGESFGMVIIEALAAGASVAASDLPAFRELLAGADPGVAVTFRTGDAAALVSAVSSLLEGVRNPSDAREFASRFDWGVVGPQVVRAYERAAARRG